MIKMKNVLIGLVSACAVTAAAIVAINLPKNRVSVSGEPDNYVLSMDYNSHWDNVHAVDDANNGGTIRTKSGTDLAFKWSNNVKVSDGSGLLTFTNSYGEFRNVDPINGLIKIDYNCSHDINLFYGFSPNNLNQSKVLPKTGSSWEPDQSFTFDDELGHPAYFKIDCSVQSQVQRLKFYYSCKPSVDPYRIDGNWEYVIHENTYAEIKGYSIAHENIPEDCLLTIPQTLGGKSVRYINRGVLSNVPWVKHLVLPFVGTSYLTNETAHSFEFGSIFRSSNPVGDVNYVPIQQHSNTWFIPKSLKTITLISANRDNNDADKFHYIPDYAFYGVDQITEVNIYGPTTAGESTQFKISRIGKYAFANCTNISAIYLPTSISIIDEGAFAGNPNMIIRSYGSISITDVHNPNYAKVTERYNDTVTYNGVVYDLYKKDDNVYANAISTSLTSKSLHLDGEIVVGEKTYVCKSIANRAFENCSTLERIYLPSGMEKVGHYAFKGTYKASIVLGDTPTSEVYLSDWDKDTGVVVPNYAGAEPIEQLGVTYLPLTSGYFADYISGSVTTLQLDQFDVNQPVYVAAYFANANSSITSLSLPKNITLGDYSFFNCSKLQVLQYAGTVSEWNALIEAGQIGVNSFANTLVTQVICNGGSTPI